ncbi:hypothetical protein [Mycolicibacterium neworleansense]|uniref:Uncharacterized protein n=1 Tax=Mycolicibacterium neworleansense TaxID=146018 RepID=A0A0H5RHK4_9MYCO|nr:hypothetical protein [Mycolicibacterium neworleansense]MCV7362119.1 hypothetical protein [Mycolicibacterium neworleansense]CRZ13473.1 hypothetical protein BN2156_00307 [Mycolicibacterium neworleansense]
MNYPQGGSWQHMPPNMPPPPYPGQPYSPGYYAPPQPPKKKKTWLWILLAVLTVVVVAVGGGIAFVVVKSKAHNREMTLTLEVTGTGRAGVWYTPDLTVKQVDLPWSAEITIPESDSFELDVGRINRDAAITCTVSIGGREIVTNTLQPSDTLGILICKAELDSHLNPVLTTG